MSILIVFGVLFFAYGTIFGSFLNVVIYRVPLDESIVKGSSHCTGCGHKLSPPDLVPIFSWLFLHGKCRYCGEKISPRYLIVELLTGLLYVASYVFFFVLDGDMVKSIVFCVFFSVLIVVAFIDYDHQYIYDIFSIIILMIAILSAVILGGDSNPSIMERLIGLVCVSSVLAIIALVSHETYMGWGDVFLFAACGAMVGWKLILLTLVLGSILGAVIGLFKLAGKHGGKPEDHKIPFIPFIAIGLVISALLGDRLIEMYINMFYM